MKRTLKPVFQIFQITAIALTLIFAGQAFGAQSSKKSEHAPARVNMQKLEIGGGNPDLKAIALTVNPKTPHIGGGPITIKVTIKNRGTAATSAPCSRIARSWPGGSASFKMKLISIAECLFCRI